MSRAMTWVEAHPTEDLLAIGTEDGEVMLWGRGGVRQRLSHESFVVNVRWSPDGQRLVVAEQCGRLSLYDAGGGRRATIETGHETLYGTAFHGSGAWFVSGGVVGKARVWHVKDSFVEAYCIPAAKAPAVRAVGFAGDTLLLGFEDGYFEAWVDQGQDWVAGGEVFGSGPLASMAMHPQRDVVVFGGGRGSMAAVSTARWETVEIWRGEPPRPIAVNQIAFAPDGEHFVAACSDAAARLFRWCESVGSMLGTPFHHRSPQPEWAPSMIVSSACFDRARPRVYTAHFDGTVQVWDVSTWPRRVLTLRLDGASWELQTEDGRRERGSTTLWEELV